MHTYIHAHRYLYIYISACMNLALHPLRKPACYTLFFKCLFHEQNPEVSFAQFNLTISNFDYQLQESLL